jgi:hypothetical protein
MSPLAEFLRSLVSEGRAVLRPPPVNPAGPDREAADLLAAAFADYRLAVAGPPLVFDAPTALAAAVLVYRACWALIDRGQPAADLTRSLALPGPPRTPAQHLSADLTLRYLAQVHQRARAHEPADALAAATADVLRRWPLSGVLSGVEDGPLTPVDFAGHRGLGLLYAERWCRGRKPAWAPGGAGREYLELVWDDLGRDPALLPRAAEPAGVADE